MKNLLHRIEQSTMIKMPCSEDKTQACWEYWVGAMVEAYSTGKTNGLVGCNPKAFIAGSVDVESFLWWQKPPETRKQIMNVEQQTDAPPPRQSRYNKPARQLFQTTKILCCSSIIYKTICSSTSRRHLHHHLNRPATV